MYPNPSTRLLLKRHTPAALATLSIVLGIAVYIELLGWRILDPELSLARAWSQTFMLGALRTTAGAALFGTLPLLIGTITRRTRRWNLSHPVLLWGIGAGTFLLAIAALVLWAP